MKPIFTDPTRSSRAQALFITSASAMSLASEGPGKSGHEITEPIGARAEEPPSARAARRGKVMCEIRGMALMRRACGVPDLVANRLHPRASMVPPDGGDRRSCQVTLWLELGFALVPIVRGRWRIAPATRNTANRHRRAARQ